MQLRDYQKEAVEATILALDENNNNPCIVAPTGSGKSIIIAFLIKELLVLNSNARFLILAHIKELIVQNYDKVTRIIPDCDVGIFCAGLDKKEGESNILFGSLLSCVNSLERLGNRDYVIIDEAHRLSPKDKTSYQKIIKHFNCKVIGLTATPFRTTDGSIVGGDNVLGTICYNISIQSLINDGYISKPVTKDAINSLNTDGIHIKQGDFDLNEMTEKWEGLVANSVNEVIEKAALRKYFICFCCTVEHAKLVCDEMILHGIDARVLHSKVGKEERNKIIKDFKNKEFRCLVNVSILTEGFDAPFVDCIILMRATVSPGLYCQMVGRGFRIDEGKKDFLVLDFGENARRHGCIDDIQYKKTNSFSNKKKNAPVKICPMCRAVVNIASINCNQCDYKFILDNKIISTKVSWQADEAVAILSSEESEKEFPVNFVDYSPHYKEGKPPSLKITYITGGIMHMRFYEYICIMHDGYARTMAIKWWSANVPMQHHFPINKEIDEIVALAKNYALRPARIKVKKNGKFWNICGYAFS